MKRTFVRGTISNKVLLVVSFVILFLAAMILVLNAWSEARLQAELRQALLYQNQYFLSTLNRDLLQIKQRQGEVLEGEPIKRLTYLPSFLSAREIQYNAQWLTREMAVLQDTNPLVKDARIYVPSGGHAIHVNYPSLFVHATDFQARYAGVEDSVTAYRPMDGSYHFVMAYPSQTPLEYVHYVIDVTLSNEAIAETLDQVYMGRDGLVLLASADMGWMVSNSAFAATGADAGELLAEGMPDGAAREGKWVTIGGAEFLLFVEPFGDYALRLLTLYPEHSMRGSAWVYRLWYWLAAGLATGFLGLLGVYLKRQVHRPMRALVTAFERVQAGDLHVRLAYSGRDEFSYLYSSFNTTVAQLEKSIEETYAYRLLAREAELKQLQSQINPHFLYNCFFVLYNMAELEDTDSIMRMTQYLGGYYRYVFRAEGELATLEEEFAQARNYLGIQSLRFGDRLSVSLEPVPEAWRQAPVPRLLFQPIVENIFAHGLKTPGGTIRVVMEMEESALTIHFEDDGAGMTKEAAARLAKRLEEADAQPKTLSGLLNVHRRLRLHFGAGSGLAVSCSDLGGLKVSVRIER